MEEKATDGMSSKEKKEEQIIIIIIILCGWKKWRCVAVARVESNAGAQLNLRHNSDDTFYPTYRYTVQTNNIRIPTTWRRQRRLIKRWNIWESFRYTIKWTADMCERENMRKCCVSAVRTAVYDCIKTIYRQYIFSGCLCPIPSPKHNKKKNSYSIIM